MSTSTAVAQNRRTRSRPPSAASSRKSDDPSAAAAAAAANGNGNGKAPSKPTSPNHVAGERTVKKLRLSKALTIPEGTTVSEACRRMAARRVDAVLLTDANGLLSGIVTYKDTCTGLTSLSINSSSPSSLQCTASSTWPPGAPFKPPSAAVTVSMLVPPRPPSPATMTTENCDAALTSSTPSSSCARPMQALASARWSCGAATPVLAPVADHRAHLHGEPGHRDGRDRVEHGDDLLHADGAEGEDALRDEKLRDGDLAELAPVVPIQREDDVLAAVGEHAHGAAHGRIANAVSWVFITSRAASDVITWITVMRSLYRLRGYC